VRARLLAAAFVELLGVIKFDEFLSDALSDIPYRRPE
jgi:hypothetical protein